ncbi:glutamate synthase large subunit [Rubinisphaera margarita]|uniref:glutamate synthase large subunit n=1 Tax=Rubinisphaera margarita TaxID=2909586 RepID=UPI001EE836D8|nr:glutamate synthase large subunit [Rubinisphaera margarita]MCG6155417.1 glutamate synthase large subunit [Rubinisphaera margarita]
MTDMQHSHEWPFRRDSYPPAFDMYSPDYEHENCGVGFVANIKGERSHQLVDDADRLLRHMDHRGACGCEENTGDGAGMLTGLPDGFLRDVVKKEFSQDLPEAGRYAAGVIFLPNDAQRREHCKTVVNDLIEEYGQKLVGWRDLPTDPDTADVGPTARACMPAMEMLIVAAGDGVEQAEFDRKLFLIRKRASHKLRVPEEHPEALLFYSCSLSSSIIIYKGMLTSFQLMPFFKDLQDPNYKTHLAMVHSRFSTNTLPSWDRAQPCRYMAHNGEINTLRGNKNWIFARQGMMQSERFGDELQSLFPIIESHCSDSGSFDNALELLLQAGRSLPEAVMMMIPEAWQNHHSMSEEKRAFYEYHSALQEPWDGPASISFTDGHYIGAVLDRNGLRPSRYYVTKDDKVIMASEVGVVEVDPDNVKSKGRLQPGKMFLVDFEQGRIIGDDEVKNEIATKRPYQQWLEDQRITLGELPHADIPQDAQDEDDLLRKLQAFGYTTETMNFMLLPMLRQKRDPVGSMGDDTALACLSDKPRMLYDYFKQLFAQVTNPAIDSIREEVIMSLECFIGPEGNLLDSTPEHCHRLAVPHPILTNGELSALKHLDYRHWKTKVIDITYPRSEGAAGMKAALDRICQEAVDAINENYSIIILSDRALSADRVAMSSLMATGAVHHHLVKHELRTRLGIVVESGEAREVHHFCLLTGYGADAVNPYMAFAAVQKALRDGDLVGDWDEVTIVKALRKAVAKGMLKVFAKMGISTLASYKGAQIFEAVGLNGDVVDRCFVGTASRIKGVTLDILAEENLRRHAVGYPERDENQLPVLPNQGLFAWRAAGEKHAWNPYTISKLQEAARSGNREAYFEFAKLSDEEATRNCHLRGLLKIKEGKSIPLSEVEPASEIVKRFCTGAMSYGSISAESHETLAIAMNRLKGKSNTGEGGEDYNRFEPMPNGDSKRSAIKQIASGRFGVTSWYLTNADELQIKISQGAKPGEGGELPGKKVNKIIAATRHSTPGVGLISPPPHHDIYSIEDLAQLIFDLKNSNPSSRISVKLVSEVGVGTIATGVAKGHADNILISGDNGGTGASPLTSIKHAGLPWELGLAETHKTLVMNDLRSRIRLQTDGQLRTGRDVAIACMLGAEEFGFATAPLIAVGCIMMRKCHLNTCPVGIATQDPELRAKFNGMPDHVVNYLFMVAEDTRNYMAQCGFRTIEEMCGRSDHLDFNSEIDHWKARHLDLSSVLALPKSPYPNAGTYCTRDQNHELERVLDQTTLIPMCQPAIQHGEPVDLQMNIQNIDRAFGTTLSHEVSKKWGPNGLPEDTIRIKCLGSAGQSLGAWMTRGITIEVEGDANDYVGKGLCGGKIVVYPPEESEFNPAQNIIAGNVCLYGATSGELYLRGVAAERFAVRNSGATAVVEGVGDHGCEYMTGGKVIVLGQTGRNFAAGMSGGVAYVYQPVDLFRPNCNLELVELETIETPEEAAGIRQLIENHQQYTGSCSAAEILSDWDNNWKNFVKVMPVDYKRALAELAKEEMDQEPAAV